MYKIGVTLRHNDIFDATDPEHGIVAQLSRFLPDFVILDIREPKDLKMVELFSKLGIAAYPIFDIGRVNFAMFKEMVMQSIVVLNTNRIYLRVTQNLTEAMKMHVDATISFLSTESPMEEPLNIFIQAPAVHFMRHDVASYALTHARGFGMGQPIPMFVNTDESLKLLNSPAFQNFLEREQAAQLTIQIFMEQLEGFTHDISSLFQWDRDIVFIGMNSLRWFRQNMLIREGSTNNLPETAIALARPMRNRVSAWKDPACMGATTRKFQIGDPDVVIVEFIPGNKARTADGDFIHLQYFNVEKL